MLQINQTNLKRKRLISTRKEPPQIYKLERFFFSTICKMKCSKTKLSAYSTGSTWLNAIPFLSLKELHETKICSSKVLFCLEK